MKRKVIILAALLFSINVGSIAAASTGVGEKGVYEHFTAKYVGLHPLKADCVNVSTGDAMCSQDVPDSQSFDIVVELGSKTGTASATFDASDNKKTRSCTLDMVYQNSTEPAFRSTCNNGMAFITAVKKSVDPYGNMSFVLWFSPK